MIRGDEFLARYPGFRLIGRSAELKHLCALLMRQKSNSVLMVGPGGVGSTAICLGLQAMKSDPDAPFDIVSKRIFWMDTDGLFSAGNGQEANAQFQRMIAQLWKTPDSLLIIKDTRVFIEAAANSGNAHFINALTMAVKSGKTQVILEVRDQDLDYVLKWHSDIRESYTLMDVPEPRGDALRHILDGVCHGLTAFHGIRISEDAIAAAIELTTKYQTDALTEAQPARAITVIDRALATYRLTAHQTPPKLVALQEQINKAEGSQRAALENQLRTVATEWATQQERIKALYRELRDGETAIHKLDEEIEQIQQAEREKDARLKDAGIEAATESTLPKFNAAAFTMPGGLESPAIQERRQKIKLLQGAVDAARVQFQTITTEINKELQLDRKAVMDEFSAISGIDQFPDENEVLRNLEASVGKRVFGQNHVVVQVADGVKAAKIGGMNGDQPLAYLFIGPSGVGKTEVARSLAAILLNDPKALLRFDMGEYMEKHSVAKLIGAPPGYEGFEAGGILTNAMRKNRRRVILFDETEKAHPDVFNVLLAVLDDGRLTDNVGRTVDFSEAIIIMTSNIGQPFFLNKDLPFDEALKLALVDLENEYRPEFLNRFAGRENIIAFNRLEVDSIGRIVRRELDKMDAVYRPKGFQVVFDDETLPVFCEKRYDPRVGARGLPGIIRTRLQPPIVNRILDKSGPGEFHFGFDANENNFTVRFEERHAA